MPLIALLLIAVAVAAVAVCLPSFIAARKSRRQPAGSDSDDSSLWIEGGPEHTTQRHSDHPLEHGPGGHEHPGYDGHDVDGHDSVDVGDHDSDHFDFDHF